MTSYTTGPGSLIFGDPGTPQEMAAQITSCTVTWDVDTDDDIPVLSGAVESGEDVFTAKLEGNLLQDITESGITTWTWTNKGAAIPFVFIPNDVVARHVSGIVKVRPTDVGGDVKKKAASDFEFPCVGEPQLGDVAP